jgi:hypothetical protein
MSHLFCELIQLLGASSWIGLVRRCQAIVNMRLLLSFTRRFFKELRLAGTPT